MYKLHYFNLRARGELLRLIFAAADVRFEDHRIEFKDWLAIKPSARARHVAPVVPYCTSYMILIRNGAASRERAVSRSCASPRSVPLPAAASARDRRQDADQPVGRHRHVPRQRVRCAPLLCSRFSFGRSVPFLILSFLCVSICLRRRLLLLLLQLPEGLSSARSHLCARLSSSSAGRTAGRPVCQTHSREDYQPVAWRTVDTLLIDYYCPVHS